MDGVSYFDSHEALTRILPSHAPLIQETLLSLNERT